jgi:hypothetical protein
MVDARDLSQPPELSKDRPKAVGDRRRPGRSEDVNPLLIPLLRDSGSTKPVAEEVPARIHRDDDLGPFKGLLVGLLLVMPFWCLVAFILWWIVT